MGTYAAASPQSQRSVLGRLLSREALRLVGVFTALLLVMMLLGTDPSRAGENDKNPKYPNIVRPVVQFGSYGLDDAGLVAPRGVALANDMSAYVADCALDAIKMFNASGQFRGQLKHPSLACPQGLELTSSSTLLVANTGSDEILEFSLNGDLLRRIGSRILSEPTAVDSSGSLIYVTSRGDMSLKVIDSRTTRVLVSVKGSGSKPGQFKEPSGVSVDKAGNIYVADTYNHRVQVFDSNGLFLRSFGQFGSYPGQLAGPVGIAVLDSSIYIADSVNHRVQVFDLNGNLEYQFGRHPESPHQGHGHTHYPLALAVDPMGQRAIVCEKNESRCQEFDLNAARNETQDVSSSAWWNKYPYFHYRKKATRIPLLIEEGYVKQPSGLAPPSWPAEPTRIQLPVSTTNGEIELMLMSEEDLHRVSMMEILPSGAQSVFAFGSYGTEVGQFVMPQGAAMDPWGRIWVADSLNNRLQIFDVNGHHLRTISSTAVDLSEPGGVTVDEKGFVFVPDAGHDRIVVLNKEGRLVRTWGSPGTKKGEFGHPISVALSPDGQIIYTTELYNSRIQSFDRRGNFLSAFGKRGTGPGETVRAMNVTTDPVTGDVLVTDDAADQVLRFSSKGRFLDAFGEHGSGEGELVNPQGLVVDEARRVWVVDYGNHRGQAFDEHGNFLHMFGEGAMDTTHSARHDSSEQRSNAFSLVGFLILVGLSAFLIRRLRRSGRVIEQEV